MESSIACEPASLDIRGHTLITYYIQRKFLFFVEKKWKGKTAIRLRNIEKANKKGKLNIILRWKNGGSSSRVIWEEFLPCWTAYILSFPLRCRGQAINLRRVRQGGKFTKPATLAAWRLYCFLGVGNAYGYRLLLFSNKFSLSEWTCFTAQIYELFR